MLVVNDLIASNYPSQTSSVSIPQWSQKLVRASFQVTVSSGTIAGSFAVQVSNDYAVGLPPNQFTPTNWVTLNSTTVLCSSTATVSTFLLPYAEYSYNYMRLIYTASTASGVYSVRMNAQGF